MGLPLIMKLKIMANWTSFVCLQLPNQDQATKGQLL